MPTMLNLMKMMKELWLYTFLKDDSFKPPLSIRLLVYYVLELLHHFTHIVVLVIDGEMSFFRKWLPQHHVELAAGRMLIRLWYYVLEKGSS